jgi:hypothetical protein
MLVDHLILVYEIVLVVMNKRRDESLQLFGTFDIFYVAKCSWSSKEKINLYFCEYFMMFKNNIVDQSTQKSNIKFKHLSQILKVHLL